MRGGLVALGSVMALVFGCGGTDAVSPPSEDASTPPAESPDAGWSLDDAGRNVDAGPVDASDSGAAGPPTDGLVLWLDPDVNVTVTESGVSAWADRTGKSVVKINNDAPQRIEAGIGARKAIRIASNGKVHAQLPSEIAMRPFSVAFVIHSEEADKEGYPVATQLRPGLGTRFSFEKDIDVLHLRVDHLDKSKLFRVNAPVGAFSSKAHVVAARRKDAVLEFRTDGISARGTDPDGALRVGTYWELGALSSYEQAFGPVRYGDVLLYDADLDDATLAAAEAYLEAKYGL